jgi:hypothetical protein
MIKFLIKNIYNNIIYLLYLFISSRSVVIKVLVPYIVINVILFDKTSLSFITGFENVASMENDENISKINIPLVQEQPSPELSKIERILSYITKAGFIGLGCYTIVNLLQAGAEIAISSDFCISPNPTDDFSTRYHFFDINPNGPGHSCPVPVTVSVPPVNPGVPVNSPVPVNPPVPIRPIDVSPVPTTIDTSPVNPLQPVAPKERLPILPMAISTEGLVTFKQLISSLSSTNLDAFETLVDILINDPVLPSNTENMRLFLLFLEELSVDPEYRLTSTDFELIAKTYSHFLAEKCRLSSAVVYESYMTMLKLIKNYFS